MKILFLCPSLEPGRDGVGDYTRRLGAELQKSGHSCLCVAINDSYTKHQQEERNGSFSPGIPRCDDQTIIRLPSCQSWSKRFAALGTMAQEFDPEWISLQYVPHGFHAKGLPLVFAWGVQSLRFKGLSHVMFHEVWGGSTSRLRDRVVYALQKRLLVHIHRQLRPRVVNVTNETYRQRLESIGIASEVLPLFSNIPLTPYEAPRNRAERRWVFAIFGTLRKGWEFERLLAEIERARETSGIEECRFISVGRLGDYGHSLWEGMKQSGYKRFVFEMLGELEESDVSRVLHSADFGIAVSPLEILDKSGAVAAMREHGLPVIVTRFMSPVTPDVSRTHPELILLDKHFQHSLRVAKCLPCRELLPSIANSFMNSLLEAQ